MDRSSPRWEILTRPFADDEVELLPKFTGKKDANGRVPRDAYRRCDECGGYHPFPCVHLKYVGHASITMRLNEVDPTWNWEPVATDADGLPLVKDGCLWIRLTVLGVTRLGVGDAQSKRGTDATKEIVGDAIRNAAMRFGVGTYLWSKSERAAKMAESHDDGQDGDEGQKPAPEPATSHVDAYRAALVEAKDCGLSIKQCMADVATSINKKPEEFDAADVAKACHIVEALIEQKKADTATRKAEQQEVVIEFD
ncbi:hypothetical protein [Gordonibacter urolithinfaciens]|uniref:hypothetical protein n=1 Tax=Gordonibacter urolithinfaciens TaxID=1335613 RepID=UPI003AAEE28A